MNRLHVIVGSIRPERQVEPLTRWVVGRASAHKEFEVETLDLRDWPLPMFAEGMKTIGDLANPTYSSPIVKRWNQKIAEADAYLFITPEYNHSIPAVLKNAIDSVFVSFAFRNSQPPSSGTAVAPSAAPGPSSTWPTSRSRPRWPPFGTPCSSQRSRKRSRQMAAL